MFTFPGEDDVWFVIATLHGGLDAEFRYVLHDLRAAFLKHLGCEAEEDDEPGVLHGVTTRRTTAGELAASLVAIDATPRDPAFEVVFDVHAL